MCALVSIQIKFNDYSKDHMMFRSQQTAAICVNTDSAAAMAIFKQQCVANDHDFATQAQNGV